MAHDTSVSCRRLSAKDTKGSFTSVDKWDQIDRRRLITLKERDVNEISQTMTRRRSEERTRPVSPEEGFRFKIERVFTATATKYIPRKEIGRRVMPLILSRILFFPPVSLPRFLYFLFCVQSFRILSPFLWILGRFPSATGQ